MERLLAVAPGTIGVGTVRNVTVPVVVEITDVKPDDDLNDWDQVTECSIEITPLTGEEIPLGSRIVAIANTLDSITSDRPYRPGQSFEAVRKEIQLWSGRQFDPQIVGVFLNMPDNIWDDLRKDIRGQT